MIKDELGMRMKNYEAVSKISLDRKIPVAIRIDGKAFHTFTKDLHRPFDDIFISTMQKTMQSLCENIQGCVLGYTQSDEITLILVDYENEKTDAWFGYQVQKLCSVSASMATYYFNQHFRNAVFEYMSPACAYLEETIDENEENMELDTFIDMLYDSLEADEEYIENNTEEAEYYTALVEKMDQIACFDSRCFNIPVEEVTNLIYWRQVDAIRNSIQMVGQAYFSPKELHEKNQTDIIAMLFTHKNIDWKDFPSQVKHGSCCIKKDYIDEVKFNKEQFNCEVVIRAKWVIDTEIPVFKGENREYIDKLVYIGKYKQEA